MRDDLNVPLDGGRVTDDGRIRAALPTLGALLDRGAKVIVCAHLGRPAGRPDPDCSLAPVAARLGELLGIPLVYQLGPDLRPDALGGQYLYPHAARGSIAAITDTEEVRYEQQATR